MMNKFRWLKVTYQNLTDSRFIYSKNRKSPAKRPGFLLIRLPHHTIDSIAPGRSVSRNGPAMN